MANFQKKSKNLGRNPNIKQNCAEKNFANCNKLYIFENSNKQKYLQNFYKLIVYSRKTEYVQIPFNVVCAKNSCKISCETCLLLL